MWRTEPVYSDVPDDGSLEFRGWFENWTRDGAAQGKGGARTALEVNLRSLCGDSGFVAVRARATRH